MGALEIRSIENIGRATPRVAAEIGRRGARAWDSRRPSVVLVPTRAHAMGLAQELALQGCSLLGVEFLTPTLFRRWLRRRGLVESRVADVAQYRFALAAGAPREEQKRLAGLAPYLFRFANQLAIAGAAGEPVASLERYQDAMARAGASLAEAGFVFPGGWDLQLLAEARKRAPCIGMLVVHGFSGADWELMHLLLAAASLAEEGLLYLEHPRAATFGLDAAFIGTLEHWTGGTTEPEAEATSAGEPEARVFAARNESDEARRVAEVVSGWLDEDAEARIAVLVPQRGILSRELSRRFEQEGIPHFDGHGQLRPGTLPGDGVAAWIAFHRAGTVATFFDFLERSGVTGSPVDPSVRRGLERAFSETLTPDFRVLAAWLEANLPRVARRLAPFGLLPEEERVRWFSEEAAGRFRAMGWAAHAEALEEGVSVLRGLAEARVRREVWLEWFEETCRAFYAVRSEESGHPFARVQILRPEEIESAAWTHLMLAGAVEGAWPPKPTESLLLDARESVELNRRARESNAGVVGVGSAGAGQEVLPLGRGLLLSPADRVAVERARFERFLELPSKVLAASLHLHSEPQPDVPKSPSDPFEAIFRKATAEPLSAAHLEHLAEAPFGTGSSPSPADCVAVRRARASRLDPGTPFDEYLFSFREAPEVPLDLPATSWERALQTPHAVWMERIAGLHAPPEWNSPRFPATIGSWTHRWLAGLGAEDAAALPGSAERRERISRTAAREADRMALVFAAAGGAAVPVWWEGAWRAALSLALRLSDLLEALPAGDGVWVEHRLSPRELSFPSGRLVTHGNADLILRGETGLCVVDFKTRSLKVAKAPRFSEGEAVQISLYALLATAEFGSPAVGWLVGAEEAAPTGPYQPDPEIPAWEALVRMGTEGCFGMRGELRSRFVQAPAMPWATLAIPKEVLEQKRRRTFGDAVLQRGGRHA